MAFCLRLDSDVLWIQKATNDSLYHLIDLYAISNKFCESILLQCLTIFHKEMSLYAPNHYLIDVIGLIAQQGSTQTSAKTSLRIVLFAVLIMNFLLYNYYTASIVGELLSSSNQGPMTMDQLANAPLLIVFNNDSYNRALTK
uniref:Uncharacterized protein n=1 Tax=Anopheles maculatus TaxID=74869 RepID=A0A182SWY3_9DIPT